ncbi:bifunctional DNA-formamidopyrimidine glycosylase/DNA-(apurinic or apyrimidinic site) lyase [Micrococcus sp.]|uniref:bifunctional DNA-formamidopyrimidine glycosylase/DNA-(apurinic or apyrimidinic site) lyase n=1 Tax=Micrococcus sp. TaxID=1271 RepID=UPI002A91D3E6|nr:bifunctional DNA-formamidopyrimidine glycosylase/DNA-(apurinic or apyrimidinic site) lyase [Micrococcus sp.]MDY6055656.1 bifunctional DNA-formamidopyrimidine glycosylase/DNA-(apurinic or apyrimidinic site) lyase [Micrococcus sp.]
MPELPEAEVVRRGMAPWVASAVAGPLEVLDARSLRRSPGGPEALRERLDGARLAEPARRGKFLWIPLAGRGAEGEEEAVVVHLGMSGQVRADAPGTPDPRHLRLRLPVRTPGGQAAELRFADQRVFGGWWLDRLVTDPATGEALPSTAAHLGLDPLHPAFDPDAVHARLVRRRSTVKRALLDQGLVSGIGNIYADEALWAARVHPERPTERMSRAQTRAVLTAVQEVMRRALEAGGTSFDALYVNVDGRSGEHARSLQAYGRTGQPCRRCAAEGRAGVIVREPFMNRASHLCPVCQPRPRRRVPRLGGPARKEPS